MSRPAREGVRKPGGSRLSWWCMLVPLWLAAAMFVWRGLFQVWLPWDDGALAHAAERILQGELPHRDFDAVYTGGLEWLHGLSFRLFGTSLHSMRVMLFL